MSEVTLLSAVERTESSSATERARGIGDLKRILGYNQRNLQSSTFKDTSFHKIFDALFRYAANERPQYLKSLSSASNSTKTAAANRLESGASVLRLIVEIGASRIKSKTARALVDHIRETLLDSHGNTIEPIALDYAKCLNLIVSYPPHAEHLPVDDWQEVAQFCIDRLRGHDEELEQDLSPEASIKDSHKSLEELSLRLSKSTNRKNQAAHHRGPAKQFATELLSCLRHLVEVPAAPLESVSDGICSTIIPYLEAVRSVSNSEVDALTIVNIFLAYGRVEATDLVVRLCPRLLNIARHQWPSKSIMFNNGLLNMLVMILPHTKHGLNRAHAGIRESVKALSETLLSEYSKRAEKDQLRMEDLDLRTTESTSDLSNAIIALRDGEPRTEANWTILTVLTWYSSSWNPVHDEEESLANDDNDNDNERPSRKRLRHTHWIDELVGMTRSIQISQKVCALQLLTMMNLLLPSTGETISQTIDSVLPNLGDDNSAVASWGLLALTSSSLHTTASRDDMRERWSAACQVACRAINAFSTSRAASHFLFLFHQTDLMSRQSFNDLVEACGASMEVNGPAIFSDASSALLRAMIQRSRSDHLPCAGQLAERVLAWLYQKWRPHDISDRAQMACNANLHFDDVLDLIHVCASQDRDHVSHRMFFEWSAIGQAWILTAGTRDILSYLLLDESPPIIPIISLHEPAPSDNMVGPVQSNVSLALTLCTKEVQQVLEQLRSGSTGRSITSKDATRNVCSLICVASCLTNCLGASDSHRARNLRSTNDSMFAEVRRHLSSADCDQENVDVATRMFCTPQQTRSLSSDGGQRRVPVNNCTSNLSSRMHSCLESREESIRSRFLDHESEMMDIDENLESQNSGSKANDNYQSRPRRFMSASFDASVLRGGCLAYTKLAYCLSVNSDTDEEDDNGSSEFVDYIISLPSREIVASQSVLSQLPALGMSLIADDVERLLSHLSEKVLTSYSEGRSEATMCLVLDFMLSHIELCANTVNKALYELSIDLYDFFVVVRLPVKVLSPDVQRRLSDLLLQLLSRNSEYGQNEGMPSVRTTIFQMLREGGLVVKQYIAERIHVIFSLYTLAQHEAVFDDLVENLPTDSGWLEGIALRIYALSILGSRWHTLLRRSVYHIFETAGKVVASSKHAALSMSAISSALGLESSRALFKLFSSQLLYTWLIEHQIQDIPHTALGYQTATDFLLDNREEIYSQLLLHDKQSDAKYCTDLLKSTQHDMIRHCIAKTVAYAISQDVTDIYNSKPATFESRIREMFSSSPEYVALVKSHALEIVAQFWISMQQDASVDKAFEKRRAHQRANTALRTMKEFGSSTRPPSGTLQPAFKSKCIVDQLDRVCRRANSPLEEIFNPAGFTVLCRSLVDTVHPALGPLFACQVIQKLRILVAVSEDTPLQGYPLQMLLQILRPFLIESQCADDTIGILRYLYDSGKDNLRQNMSLLTGSTVLTLLYLKSFIDTKKDTTTQESHYRSTVSKIQSFHDWLITYLLESQAFVSERNQARFVALVVACRDLVYPVTAVKDHPASILIQSCLDDSQSNHPIMEPTPREDILSFLCDKFEAPSSRAKDVLGDDTLSIKYASRLWDSLTGLKVNGEYSYWVSLVLGRAYAATGRVDMISGSMQVDRPNSSVVRKPALDSDSKLFIVTKLRKLLMNTDRGHAGVIERTMRSMFARYTDAAELVEFEQYLPTDLVVALGDSEKAALPISRPKDPAIAGAIDSRLVKIQSTEDFANWAVLLADLLCELASHDPMLGVLPSTFAKVEHLAEDLMPFVIHLALLHETDKSVNIRNVVSSIFTASFLDRTSNNPRNRLLLRALVYLYKQPIPQERIRTDRLQWLDIDLISAATAASNCGMAKTALFLIEIRPPPASPTRSSMRSSVAVEQTQNSLDDMLLEIYKRIDDPDSFYGVEQPPSLTSVMNKLDHEGDGLKALMLHSARLDASLRNAQTDDESDSLGMVKALGVLNIQSLTNMLLTQRNGQSSDPRLSSTLLESARKLDQWDISSITAHQSSAGLLFRTLQSVRTATSIAPLQDQLHSASEQVLRDLRHRHSSSTLTPSSLRSLAVLSEISDLTNVRGNSELYSMWLLDESRQQGWDIGQVKESSELSSYRESIFGVLRRNKPLRDALKISARDAFLIETKTVVGNSIISRKHGSLQQALTASTYLSSMVPLCEQVGLQIDAAAKLEAASVLWKQGESSSSVRMLRELCSRTDLDGQPVAVGRAGMLAQLGHQVASARLEKPEDVIARYLKPAIEHLKKSTSGTEAGQVFFEFASFCDQQLQNPDSLEDFHRLSTLRLRKQQEYEQLEELLKSTPASQKDKRNDINKSRVRARQWYNLDDYEWKILSHARDGFIQQSLVNYLRALQACDEHDSSVVRFFALWLEHSNSESANKAVSQYLDSVPSWKFVVLLNQQTSRLLRDDSPFQMLLSTLVSKICAEHPYHSIHHIFSSCSSPVGDQDEVAKSRKKAAHKIALRLRADKKIGAMFQKAWEANELYHNLAVSKPEVSKTNKLTLRSFKPAYQMNKRVVELAVPPATLTLDLRPAGDYRSVPVITSFRDEITIASGLSAPKILTARASDGNRYKQLFKGGPDDLRQDAIMEQVFGEVSKILRKDKETRRRDLQIRTYRVLPLSNTSGIIEFVPDSIPLHDVVVPYHAKYHPKDISMNKAREAIRNAQALHRDQRVKVYQEVTSNYQPILRHFFFERFEDPDEWFARRLAYTRSTAAISMLGYVLGLGDRHCHNILLDEKSGEVIHIDLGVAFETGRVLPVPEVVPFRLTRDIVDGMGVTKTEGVFRRCCEFTMEALRQDKDSIMTLLNVLRYDPLYSWTVSPLRAKRMQEAQDEEIDNKREMRESSEAGEAERALAVVEKKLSKTLSTAATVNELIQQATDERNLAVLFAGWAAYS